MSDPLSNPLFDPLCSIAAELAPAFLSTVAAQQDDPAHDPGDARAEAVFAAQLLRIGRYHARHQSVPGDEVEDCAMEFVLDCLQRRRQAHQTGETGKEGETSEMNPSSTPTASTPAGSAWSPAWLHRCAANHTKNFCRSRARRESRLAPWPEFVWSSGGSNATTDSRPGDLARCSWDAPDADALAPEAVLLAEEACQQLVEALGQLSPLPRHAFIRHHLRAEPIRDLAAAGDDTPHRLLRARQRLRLLLKQRGVTAADLRHDGVASLVLALILHNCGA